MANLALHNTTLSELQQFLQQMAMPVSEKFTVIFDKGIDDLSVSKQLPSIELNTSEFVDFGKLSACGMWADRQEMADSVEYVRKLRCEQWRHHND